MKWTKENNEKLISLINEGKQYEEIANELGVTKQSIKCRCKRLHLKKHKKEYHENCICKNCNKQIITLKSDERKFCSSSCSATYNNKRKIKKNKNLCLICGIETKKRNKFCSTKCSGRHQRLLNFKKIDSGDTSLNDRNYKYFLIEKYGEKCMKCGWCEINTTSGKVPIELEHKDGNSENHSLENLELLCPNCHSLTPTYRALNNGNGRHKRRERYKEGKSF
ncbi:MAG: hypothetical protein ACK5OW_01425 [bacterium]|jgi:hypothetical protein